MTEPTWKDPLLASMTWSEGVRVAIETWPYAPKHGWDALGVYNWLALHFPQSPDLWTLRSLIDAELARGREAVEVLRENEWLWLTDGDEQKSCQVCQMYKSHGHAPDCRLAATLKR